MAANTANIDLPEWVNEKTVERAYVRAMEAQRAHEEGMAECGMRAAHARNPKLMKALEAGAEVMTSMMERQQGRYMRDSETVYAHKVELTEVALWRKAYEEADKGMAMEQFRWIYGCAAELAGLYG
jgi:hypothetical protein